MQLQSHDKDLKTPFLYACENGQLSIVEYLLSQGSSTKVRSSNLHSQSCYVLIAPLQEKDKSQRTGLMYAAEVGNAELVRYLLSKGASVRDRDEQGNTALICAMSENRTNIVEILINQGRHYTY